MLTALGTQFVQQPKQRDGVNTIDPPHHNAITNLGTATCVVNSRLAKGWEEQDWVPVGEVLASSSPGQGGLGRRDRWETRVPYVWRLNVS
jgi:hypothetical protein